MHLFKFDLKAAKAAGRIQEIVYDHATQNWFKNFKCGDLDNNQSLIIF